VLRRDLVRRRQVAPRQRAFLAIRLSKRDSEARAGELFSQVERVRRLVHLELLEDVLDVRAANELLVVEDGDPAGSAKMRKFGSVMRA
jgi:hypothetical protein